MDVLVFLEGCFWTLLLTVCYAYLGYGVLLGSLVVLKRILRGKCSVSQQKDSDLPEVTFLVAAWNEEDWIEQKLLNSFGLDYPANKIHFFFVTDGSDDRTPDIIRNWKERCVSKVRLFHRSERRGKIAAVERVMPFVTTPITIFSDANTDLPADALRLLVRHYQDPKVGAVAGEKRIQQGTREAANGAGEGLYWKYESQLKQWDSELHTVVGAAGELFSIRTELFEPVPPDTLIEDFVMTLRIAARDYRVRYEPQAFASETASASVREELKRKVRIAAGGLQAVARLAPLLNPFKYGWLTFQYVSHRVLRWTIAPLALPLLLGLNIVLALRSAAWIYDALLVAQFSFYAAAVLGYVLEKRQLRFKLLFVPYYFCVMNIAVYRGAMRLLRSRQSVLWEKAERVRATV